MLVFKVDFHDIDDDGRTVVLLSNNGNPIELMAVPGAGESVELRDWEGCTIRAEVERVDRNLLYVKADWDSLVRGEGR